ncbi:MAG: DinB family protein [Candidatus Heimdallarchaeota archaeon]|nr:DinB family protein [Candidatus Heimdallarchaeota archaeon]MCK4953978.1 DinB family protein [Candidatus Heimdallarchaeota archaeon]
MFENFLKNAICRHLTETRLFISNLAEYSTLEELVEENVILPDSIVLKIPVKDGRPLGEIILHMIRSIEYYATGIATNKWVTLSYNLAEFSTTQKMLNLFDRVSEKTKKFLDNISEEMLSEQIDEFNRIATKKEILLEMLEHSVHHRGQLSVYFRLLEIDPPSISYII